MLLRKVPPCLCGQLEVKQQSMDRLRTEFAASEGRSTAQLLEESSEKAVLQVSADPVKRTWTLCSACRREFVPLCASRADV